jgi:DnaJ like chaperone protein
MYDVMTWGLYVVLCLVAGYTIFIGLGHFMTGFMAAKAEFDLFRTSAERSQGERANARSQFQENDLRSSRPWHEVLEISPNATLDQIKAAYRKKVSLYHPDRVAGLGEELRTLAEVHAKETNAAYAVACRLRGGSKWT